MVGQYSSCHTLSQTARTRTWPFPNSRINGALPVWEPPPKMESRNAQPGQRSGILGGSCQACPRPRHPPSTDRLPGPPFRPEHDIQYGIAEGSLRLAGPPLHPPISLLIGKSDIGLAGACSVCSTAAPPTLPSVHVPEYIEAPSRLYGTSRHLGRPFMLCFQLDRLSR